MTAHNSSSPGSASPFLAPESLDTLYELSKSDRTHFVGSDIRQLIGEIRRLRTTTQAAEAPEPKRSTWVPSTEEEAAELADNGRNTGGKSYYRPSQCISPNGCSDFGGPCPSCRPVGVAQTSGDPFVEAMAVENARWPEVQSSGVQTARDALRAACKAGGDLGCSCADGNYQWYGAIGSCQARMALVMKQLLEASSPVPSATLGGGE